MVVRLKFRRLLYLATLVCSTIVVFEVLVFPVIQYVTVRRPISTKVPANLAKPKVEDPHLTEITLEELLFKKPDINVSKSHRAPFETNFKTTMDFDEYYSEALEEDALDFTDTPAPKPIEVKPSDKYWFFKNGTVWPTKDSKGPHEKIWPHEAPDHDRILDQLMHIPNSYDPNVVKTVLLTNNLGAWNVPMGPDVFQECPVKACTLSNDMHLKDTADAVMFRDSVMMQSKHKRDQIWIIYILESPSHTYVGNAQDDDTSRSLVDWTATYRRDSDIVTPYEKWMYYDEIVKTLEKNRQTNFAAGKTHQVAWFVSNCHTPNNRLEYAKKLQKYISVDIYGGCGSLSCSRSSSHHCYDLLNTKYKFYLAFENSNCRDYITEKFFVNGLGNKVLPIVMGATKEQYARSAPDHSFIHVDDFESPQKLADYLHLLDSNDILYSSYFQWKGTGEFINTYFWCRLCTMIHDADSGLPGNYSDVQRWWHEKTCRNEGWTD